MRVLLIEDDQSLAAGMLTALRTEGHAVDHATGGEQGLNLCRAEPPDIVILDLGLPDRDGVDVLRTMRSQQLDIPVLILTARDSIEDKVAGLDAGANDYLTKPFVVQELLARMRALNRMRSTVLSSDMEIGNLRLDVGRHAVWFEDDPVSLSRREFSLLRALAERPGQVYSREQLEQKLYSWGEEVASNTIDVHIHNLRKKLSSDIIKTIRGVGYVLSA